MYSNIQRVEMSISFDKLSSKQLLCQCLDLAAAAFRELLKFINKQPTQIGNNSIYDFNKIISYVLQPQIFERISQSVGIKENNDKYYLKNLIFELRSLRNIWAHSTNIEYRMVHRAFDSVELLLSKLNVDKSSNIYVKVDSYRRLLIVKMAQQYLKQQSQQKNGYMTQQNRY